VKSAVAYVDQLLEALVADDNLDAERIHTIANFLATAEPKDQTRPIMKKALAGESLEAN
jgi:hypothetical protein